MMNARIFILFAALLFAAGLLAEETAAPATAVAESSGGQAPATVDTAPAPAAEPAPAVAEGSGGQAPTEQEPKAEEKPAPVEEKKIDTTVKEAPITEKKEEKSEEKKEIVRPYFGVAIASGVFGLLALASGFYFDHLAQKSFDSYGKMATREAIEAAAKKPDFDPAEYLKRTKTKYDEGSQHIKSRNYSFIGGAIFVAAGVGLFFWTEEKKPEGENKDKEKKEEPVSDKKVSLQTVGDRVTLNFSGSF